MCVWACVFVIRQLSSILILLQSLVAPALWDSDQQRRARSAAPGQQYDNNNILPYYFPLQQCTEKIEDFTFSSQKKRVWGGWQEFFLGFNDSRNENPRDLKAWQQISTKPSCNVAFSEERLPALLLIYLFTSSQLRRQTCCSPALTRRPAGFFKDTRIRRRVCVGITLSVKAPHTPADCFFLYVAKQSDSDWNGNISTLNTVAVSGDWLLPSPRNPWTRLDLVSTRLLFSIPVSFMW